MTVILGHSMLIRIIELETQAFSFIIILIIIE